MSVAAVGWLRAFSVIFFSFVFGLIHCTLGSLPVVDLAHIEQIQQLDDPASFFEDDVAVFTSHIRVVLGEQVGKDRFLDFYSYYEDSHLYYHLHHAWMHHKMASFRFSLSSLHATRA